MKVLYTFLILCLIQNSIFCQMNSSLELSGGVQYTYRKLFPNSNNDFGSFNRTFRNLNEIPNIRYRFAIGYNSLIKYNLNLKVGIGFSKFAYKEKEFIFHSVEDYFETKLMKMKFKYDYTFIEIPIAFRKELFNNLFSPYIEFGIFPSIFLSRKIIYETEDNRIIVDETRSSSINSRINISSSVSFGLNYNINSKCQLYTQLIYRTNFDPIYFFETKEFLYGTGFESGIRRRLKF